MRVLTMFGVLYAGASFFLAACGDGGSAVPAGSTSTGASGFQSKLKLTSGGESRTYDLFAPDSPVGRGTLPLVFVFHGDGDTGAGIRNRFKLEAASAQGAVFVYPDGVDKSWRFDDAAGLAKDVAFIDQLAGEVRAAYGTDASRTFAVGFSRGAYFANMLACFSTSPLRGVVAHGGGGPFGVEGSGTTFPDGELRCPQPPVRAMQIVGQNDDLLSEGRKARDHWQRVNACNATTSSYAPSPCVAFDGCSNGLSEIYCEIPDLGHAIWDKGSQTTWSFIVAQ